jgi:stage V sporulation protein B
MGGAVYACYWVMENIAHITSNVLLCAGPILVGVIVYIVLVVWTKAITREDCLLLPKGEKIAKFLKL